MWAKLDDKFHSHPKVLKALGKGAKGVAAICLWALALSWCGSHQTSRVPTAFVSVLGTGKKGADAAKVLVEVGLWQPTEEGFEVRNWHSYQHKQVEPNEHQTQSATEKQREATRERVARWRERHHPSNAHETPKKTDVTPSVTPLVTGHVTPSNAIGNAPCNAQVTERTVTSEAQNTPNALVYTRTHAPALSLTHTQIETAHTTRTRESEAVVQAKPAEPPPPAPPSEPAAPPESTERPIVAPKPSAPAQPPTASSTPPQTATQRIEAVLAECPSLAPLDRQKLASLLEGRRMASGKPVEWVEQAIRDADRSAATSALGGEPLSNSRLADLVVRYCDHARAPRPEPQAAAHPVKFGQIVQSQPAAAKKPGVFIPPWLRKDFPSVCSK